MEWGYAALLRTIGNYFYGHSRSEPPPALKIFMDEVTQSTFCYVVPNGSDDDDVVDENKSKWQSGKHFDRVIIYGVLRESKHRGVRDGPKARLAEQRSVHTTTVCYAAGCPSA